MDAGPRAILGIRLADAYRLEQHGLRVLESLVDNPQLPPDVRDRADMHRVETAVQLAWIGRALEALRPGWSERYATQSGEAVRLQLLQDWVQLERREIHAYLALMPYVRFAGMDGLGADCGAALDLQRSVLHWLEALQDPSPVESTQAWPSA